MRELVQPFLKEIGKANIQLLSEEKTTQVSLFDSIKEYLVEFNGIVGLRSYEYHCDRLIIDFRRGFKRILQEEEDGNDVQSEIRGLIDELHDCRTRWFSKQNKEDWLLKVEFVSAANRDRWDSDILKSTVLKYLTIQEFSVKRMQKWLQAKLEEDQSIQKMRADPPQRMRRKVSQVRLIESQGLRSNISWNFTATDLTELVVTMHQMSVFSRLTGEKPTQKELYNVFASVFHIQEPFDYRRMTSIKQRKKLHSSFIFRLQEVFTRMVSDTYE